MTFDREKQMVIALGNVQVGYADKMLFADRVAYDQAKDVVMATGNVTLVEPSGERVFGDEMQITGDLKDGVIRNIGIILQDRSRIAGAGARHSAERITELSKGTYSPCDLCKDDPNRPPLWQIKAVRVTHDKREKIVEYRDAWLEMFGFPVFYTPYFRHPDPTVKHKSGFLFPTYRSSSDFGFILETPYFWAISPHEDTTIRPIWMTGEFPVLAVEYRNRIDNGTIDVSSSITDNSSEQYDTTDGDLGVRGYIDAKGRFDIDRTWRWGFDVERSTNDTFMRRYGFGSPQSLNSQIFAEAFRA
ncbi:MAG: LPS assembly protein LptD, partial [Rhodospirillaceae bacterium]